MWDLGETKRRLTCVGFRTNFTEQPGGNVVTTLIQEKSVCRMEPTHGTHTQD